MIICVCKREFLESLTNVKVLKELGKIPNSQTKHNNKILDDETELLMIRLCENVLVQNLEFKG